MAFKECGQASTFPVNPNAGSVGVHSDHCSVLSGRAFSTHALAAVAFAEHARATCRAVGYAENPHPGFAKSPYSGSTAFAKDAWTCCITKMLVDSDYASSQFSGPFALAKDARPARERVFRGMKGGRFGVIHPNNPTMRTVTDSTNTFPRGALAEHAGAAGGACGFAENPHPGFTLSPYAGSFAAAKDAWTCCVARILVHSNHASVPCRMTYSTNAFKLSTIPEYPDFVRMGCLSFIRCCHISSPVRRLNRQGIVNSRVR